MICALSTSEEGDCMRNRWSTVNPVVGRGVLVALLLFLLARVMPTAAPGPPNLARDQGAVDNQDGIILAIGDVTPNDRTTLRWDWTIRDGVSTPQLYASVNATGGTGTLAFTGPISNRIDLCTVDSSQATLVRGRPPAEIRDAPELFIVSKSLVARIDFNIAPGAPGGPVIHCSVSSGFASDDPPYHQLYTPQLKIVAQGKVQLDPYNRWVCAARTAPGMAVKSECIDRSAWPTAQVAAAVDEVNRPSEQGLRDARLILVGVLAGFAGQAIWEFGKQLIDLGRLEFHNLKKRVSRHPTNADLDQAELIAVSESPSAIRDNNHRTPSETKVGAESSAPSPEHDVNSSRRSDEGDL